MTQTTPGDRVPGSTLMVLAGAKGSGKSVLLRFALKKRLPLFGAEHDRLFQGFSPPGTDLEFKLHPSEILERHTWASGPHLPYFAEEPRPPRALLVHLDLMNFCDFKTRKWEALCSPHDNLLHMYANPQARIFARYDHIVVNTLYPSWRTSAERFHGRRTRLGRKTPPNEMKLYDLGSASAGAAYDATYRAWFEFLGGLGLKRHLLTRCDEETGEYRMNDFSDVASA